VVTNQRGEEVQVFTAKILSLKRPAGGDAGGAECASS
jgi:hypothetical protein